MNTLKQFPYLSNYYKAPFTFAEKEWECIDDVFQAHKEGKLNKYKDLETTLTFSTYLKFMQNEDLKNKILTDDINFSKIKGKLGDRLKLIREVIRKI